MERNDYTQAALRTWITEHPEEVQIAHACMTLVDEWNELDSIITGRIPGQDEIIDELGDVFYGCAILQHLTAWSHIPNADGYGTTTPDQVEARIKQAHDLGTKILRSQHIDYYDRDTLDTRMQTAALLVGECLSGLAKHFGLEVDTVLANNIRKLEQRYS